MTLKELVDEYAKEGITGRIGFKAGFYNKLCKELGIKYSELSKTGKQVLKGDAIDTTYKRHEDCFRSAEYYKSFK